MRKLLQLGFVGYHVHVQNLAAIECSESFVCGTGTGADATADADGAQGPSIGIGHPSGAITKATGSASDYGLA